MEKTVLTISPENMITIVVIAVLGFGGIGLIANVVNKYVGKSNASN